MFKLSFLLRHFCLWQVFCLAGKLIVDKHLSINKIGHGEWVNMTFKINMLLLDLWVRDNLGIISHISLRKHILWFFIRPSQRDGSNEGSQDTFLLRNKKNYLWCILNTPSCLELWLLALHDGTFDRYLLICSKRKGNIHSLFRFFPFYMYQPWPSLSLEMLNVKTDGFAHLDMLFWVHVVVAWCGLRMFSKF